MTMKEKMKKRKKETKKQERCEDEAFVTWKKSEGLRCIVPMEDARRGC